MAYSKPMFWKLAGLFCILGSVLPASTIAQSTSSWIPVDLVPAPPLSADPKQPVLGASYITVEFIAARVYQKSNWWTALVENGRQAVVDATVSGSIGINAIEDVRTSGPVQLKSSDSDVDFGFRQTVIQRFPTTYNNLQLRVRISKSSKDGMDDLLKTIGDISKTTPALSVSTSTLGIVSAVKSITDYLFNKTLLEEKARSTLQFPDSGPGLSAGYYVSLAADDANQYAKYMPDPQTGANNLKWNGAQLTFNGTPIKGLTYFVTRVGYQQTVYGAPLNALSFPKPWAALYQVARRKASALQKPEDAGKAATEIRAHLTDAQSLLDTDADLVQTERDSINQAVTSDAQAKLNARIEQLSTVADPKKPGTFPVVIAPKDNFGITVMKESGNGWARTVKGAAPMVE